MTSIVISSGHGKYIRGARGNPVPPMLDEVDEARRVVDRVAELLKGAGVKVKTFHDNTSHDQNTNLHTIVNYHNAQTRDLDVSVHFNCYDTTAHGTECLYVTQSSLADDVSAAIARAGPFTDRGPKKRTDLYFLNNTEMPAILIETCFCDNRGDSDTYHRSFEAICQAIAETIGEIEIDEPEPPEPEPPEPGPEPTTAEVRIEAKGAVSIYVNGVLVYGSGGEPAGVEWMENITATEFAGDDDPQDSAYGTGRIDGDELGIALPYKWRDSAPPRVIVEGPEGDCECPIVDVGPWNTNDPEYVLHGARPLVETQYANRTPAQNGMVPSNNAAIDLTPETARMVGIDGKGKVRWRFAE